MKKLFWFSILGLLLFEVANVYFIMPMPGSQQMNSIDLAYFLDRWKWFFRIGLGILALVGLVKSTWKYKWVPAIPLVLAGAVAYMTNFVMAADHIFYQPDTVTMTAASSNKVDTARLVIGIVNKGEAKAYPIRFLGYHHQVKDSVGGRPVMVTYCTVCRTGRVFEPLVNGKHETFRLVGMDHFNAMFEDVSTKSWWRQASGEAVAGKLKGQQLPELLSSQTTLGKWLELYPSSLIMQADEKFLHSYDSSLNYESGLSRKSLTGTDSISWKEKSWVIGIKKAGFEKAYDWNELKRKRFIVDKLTSPPVLLVLGNDSRSFFAFQVDKQSQPYLNNDTIYYEQHRFLLNGKGVDTSLQLTQIPAYQEFWHSWRTFHPKTLH